MVEKRRIAAAEALIYKLAQTLAQHKDRPRRHHKGHKGTRQLFAIGTQELQKAREIALEEMEAAARQTGGTAVVGIDLDYEVVGRGGSMLMVTACGTAVTID